ncbi:hypothetical protein RhiirB3_454531 [Rhizophagus irregularis]|nr:hypothetical protein RhiirB3_454531 [Rhizophagus irregularis]
MTSVKEWIEEEIKNKRIHYFEYDKFNQSSNQRNLIEELSVNSKEINEDNYEFVKELEITFYILKLLREVDYHQKNKSFRTLHFGVEYANEGSLRDYLKKRFNSLKWNDKIQMALDITSDNFNKYLIANLGLSKKLKEVMTSNSSCVLLGNSSGRPLLSNYPQDTTLAFHISDNNLREDPIEGTSPKYQQLYQ